MKKEKILRTFGILLAVSILILICSFSALASIGWHAENGALYYYGMDGKKATGMQIIDALTYEFLPDGRLTGKNLLVETEDGIYCINGAAYVTGFRAIEDTLQFFGADGLRVDNGEHNGFTITDSVVQGHNVYVKSGTIRHYLQNNRILFSVSDYEAQLVMTADNTTAGGQTSVKIALKNNPGLAQLQIKLQFDTDMLTHSYSYDEKLLDGYTEQAVEDGFILSWNGVSDTTKDGALVTLYFDAGETQGDMLMQATVLEAKAANETEQTCKPAISGLSIGCPHEFDEYIFNNDSTCTTDGTKTATCPHCGEQHTVTAYNSKLPHSGGTASCTIKAVCAACGASYGTYNADVHLHLVEREGKQPTCYANGYSAFEQCVDCTKEIGKSVLYATNHRNAYAVDAKLPTCTETGHKEYVFCPDCDTALGFESIPATGHRNTETVPALAPTCTTVGYNEYTFCKDCNTALDKTVLPAINHKNKKNHPRKAATCTADGHTAYSYCPDCDTTFDYSVLPMLSHKNKYEVAQKPATCIKDGHTAYEYCPDCGEIFGKETIPATGHPSTVEIAAKEPTCTEPGYEAYTCCTVCFTDIGRVNLPALGHRDMTQHDALAATCYDAGHTAYSVCGICETVIGKTVLPALQHKNKSTIPAKDATCTEPGNNRYTYCPDCDTAFDKQIFPATDHVNRQFVEGLAPTCADPGYTAHYYCPDCGEKTSYEDIPALQHKNATAHPAKAPTCTEPGTSAYIACPDCGMTTGREEVPALGHQNKYLVAKTEPNCTETGITEYYYCPDCGMEEGKEVIPAKGHEFSFWITEVHAGLGREGTEIRWCGVCMETEKRATEALTLEDGKVYQCGDADRNNIITSGDARSALRYSIGLDNPSEIKMILADYDGNYEVTAEDARLLLRASLGLDDVGPFFCFVAEDGYYERIDPEDME